MKKLLKWAKKLFVLDSPGRSFREVVTDAVMNKDALGAEALDGIRDELMPAIDDIEQSRMCSRASHGGVLSMPK